jgi:hypothetical protein
MNAIYLENKAFKGAAIPNEFRIYYDFSNAYYSQQPSLYFSPMFTGIPIYYQHH